MQRRQFIKQSAILSTGLLLGCRIRNRFDLIIKNGRIFDGTGKPPYIADLGIRNDRIKAIADLSQSSADHWLDAHGLAVAPGFIDIHTHTDVELLVNPYGESKLLQGVTTEISGNCGDSPFPKTPEDWKTYRARIQEQYGIRVNWRDFAGFKKAIAKAPPAINYATFLGHGDLRAYVIGRNDVQPTSQQLRQMQKIVAEHMEQGVLGLSTGLEYAPGSYAQTPELIALCQTVAQFDGVYATHMRNEDDTVEQALEEALEICRQSGVSLQVSHLKACNQANWYKEPLLLERLSQAAASGLPVLADRYPYEAWATSLTSFLPLWARQGTTEEILARLNDTRLLPQIAEYTASRGKRIGGWDKVVISYCSTTANKTWEGKSIAQCSDESKLSPFEFIRTLLLTEKNQVGVIGFAMSYDNLKQTLAHPLITVGSDGSAIANHGVLARGKPHPRFYGTFPRFLGKFVRDEQILDLSTAIKKITLLPAEKLKLKQRGVLRPEYYADVVVFNPDTINDRATFADPHQYPTGIEYVIVNGALTVERGKLTGKRRGYFLLK